MKTRTIIGLAATTMLLSAVTQAGNFFHKSPFDFLFGNHIDTHQENNLTVNAHTGAPESLLGRFYIIYTGDTDPVSGLPIARHPRGLASDGSHDERCGVTADCVVGWEMRGLPGVAKFVSHSGVNGDDHPVWLVNRAEDPLAPATGMAIPQDATTATSTGSPPPARIRVQAACRLPATRTTPASSNRLHPRRSMKCARAGSCRSPPSASSLSNTAARSSPSGMAPTSAAISTW